MLTNVELEHYDRHLKLSSFGLNKQIQLKSARVLLIGAGGLGCPVGLYLAASGVGTIGIVDDDRVERTNLQRQIAHSLDTVGRPKVESLVERMRSINPFPNYREHFCRLNDTNVSSLIAGYDLVIDGSDNFSTRFLLADACHLARIPLLQGAVFEYQGQINLFNPGQGACYRCIFRTPPARDGLAPCAEIGVLGVVSGAIGLMMATEAVKFLTAIGASISGKMLVYDALAQTLKTIVLMPDEGCPLCGKHATIHETRQWEQPACSLSLASTEQISVEEGQELVKRGAYLLDVREEYEFHQGHLPGAIHLPLGNINQESTNELFSNDRHIVVYCQKGFRSQQAIQKLQQLGFSKVYGISGGIIAWKIESVGEFGEI